MKATDVEQAEGEAGKIYLIYDHGDSIVHDPEIEVLEEVEGELDWALVLSVAAISALISMFFTGLLVIKRRNGFP